MKDIVAGDGLLVGDRCRVRGAGEGVVETIPTDTSRTYKVRLDTGDRVGTRAGRKAGGWRSDAQIGSPVEWDAHPAWSGCSRTQSKPSR